MKLQTLICIDEPLTGSGLKKRCEILCNLFHMVGDDFERIFT
jgi:hypothetical protein